MLSKVVWNFGGQALPMLIGVLVTPFLIFRLGDDRFGLLSIAWVVVGYLSLFDFGLGRAMTRQIAIRIGSEEAQSVGVVFWSATLAMLVLGFVVALAGFVSAPFLATSFLQVPDWLQDEAQGTLLVLSLGIPVTIVSTGFRGVLEAIQDFRRVGLIRFLNGLATFMVPVAVVLQTESVVAIAGALVLARLLIAAINFGMCIRIAPTVVKWAIPRWNELKDLLTVGGWMSVSNVISPIMSSLDRFLLGAILTVGAITYYAVPFDVVTKSLIIPAAVAGVLFPAFASYSRLDRQQTQILFTRSWDTTFLVTFPLVFLFALLARPGLALWLNDDFAQRSTAIVQWLAIGVLANSLAQMPFTLLQAEGRVRSVAIIHLLELPLYIGMLYLLVEQFGILGAAIAWTARVIIDLVAMLLVALHATHAGRLQFRPAWKAQAVLTLLMVVGSLLADFIPVMLAILLTGFVLSGLLLLKTLGPHLRQIGFLRQQSGSAT